jgi:hypothetical protein
MGCETKNAKSPAARCKRDTIGRYRECQYFSYSLKGTPVASEGDGSYDGDSATL